MSGAPGDVSQMAEQSAFLAFLDFRIEACVAADGFNEIEKMVGVPAGRLSFADCLAFVVDLFPSAVQQKEGSTLSQELHTDTGSVMASRIAAVAFPGDLAGTELVGSLDRVRRLLIVLEVVATSRATDLGRTIHAQSPARQIKKMGPIVGQFTATPVPAPMPVIMHDIVPIGALWGGALPEGVVEPLWNGSSLADADGGSVRVIPGAGGVEFSDDTAMEFIHRLADESPTASLISHLNQASVLSRCSHHPLSFPRVVAAGLFDVNMFAGIAGENRGGCVPVVGSCDADGIQ